MILAPLKEKLLILSQGLSRQIEVPEVCPESIQDQLHFAINIALHR